MAAANALARKRSGCSTAVLPVLAAHAPTAPQALGEPWQEPAPVVLAVLQSMYRRLDPDGLSSHAPMPPCAHTLGVVVTDCTPYHVRAYPAVLRHSGWGAVGRALRPPAHAPARPCVCPHHATPSLHGPIRHKQTPGNWHAVGLASAFGLGKAPPHGGATQGPMHPRAAGVRRCAHAPLHV